MIWRDLKGEGGREKWEGNHQEKQKQNKTKIMGNIPQNTWPVWLKTVNSKNDKNDRETVTDWRRLRKFNNSIQCGILDLETGTTTKRDISGKTDEI